MTDYQADEGRHGKRCRDATDRQAGTCAGRDGTIAAALRESIGPLAGACFNPCGSFG